MNNLAKTIIICNLLLVVVGYSGSSLAVKNDGPGLLEQSKQVVSGIATDDAKWIEEKTGKYLPLDLEFVDEKGETVLLGDIIDRPTILLPIYFYCPNICSKNLSNLAIALNNLSSEPGKDFRVIALSFNEVESYEVENKKKRNYLKIVDEDFPADEWWFLTGTKDAILAATNAVGFRFKKMDDLTFLHPAALVTIAEDGKIIRYVYGSFLAGDIDMSLAYAAKGRPSLSVKRLLDFCFNYDPDKNKSVFQRIKLGVLAVLVGVLSFVFLYFKRKKPGIESDLK